MNIDETEAETPDGRRGGACNHRKCQGDPDGCRMLTDEALTPTADQLALGVQLVAQGWRSTSTKYRSIARWREREPKAVELIRPAALETFHGQRALCLLERALDYDAIALRVSRSDDPHVETRTLTIREFKAFKIAGGRSA